MNIQKMMKQAQKMQAELARAQEEMASQTVEATAGKVTVTATCAGDVLAIKIDPSVVDRDDVEALEDLVLAGVKQAQEAAREAGAADMKKLTGGMNIPGMPF